MSTRRRLIRSWCAGLLALGLVSGRVAVAEEAAPPPEKATPPGTEAAPPAGNPAPPTPAEKIPPPDQAAPVPAEKSSSPGEMLLVPVEKLLPPEVEDAARPVRPLPGPAGEPAKPVAPLPAPAEKSEPPAGPSSPPQEEPRPPVVPAPPPKPSEEQPKPPKVATPPPKSRDRKRKPPVVPAPPPKAPEKEPEPPVVPAPAPEPPKDEPKPVVVPAPTPEPPKDEPKPVVVPVPSPKAPERGPEPTVIPAPAPEPPKDEPKPAVVPAPPPKAPEKEPEPAVVPAPPPKAPEKEPEPAVVPAPPPKAPEKEPEPPPVPAPVPPPPEEPPVRLPGAVMVPGGSTMLTAGGEGARAVDDLSEVKLEAAKEDLPFGEPAGFVLRGPAAFLDQASAHYVLRDELGREVSRGVLKLADLKPDADGGRRFAVPTTQALARGHTLELVLVGADDRRIERRVALRLRRPPAWDHWLALIHAPYPEGRGQALAALGIRGGMAYRLNAERQTALRAEGGPFYVENVARQFLSRYHAERGLWERTVAKVLAEPASPAALTRDPSLCSLDFGRAFARELERHAEAYRQDAPLFYSLAAEPSVTRLAAALDFDFHPEALAEFRRWLERDVYGTLNALNAAWGTSFKKWDEAQPLTTGEALRRLKDGDLNFGPWVDFRAFQDHTFAKVLGEGGKVLRLTDPHARVGITGALGPFAFGGWDWARLARALDVVEAYDIGGARELWRDLAPGKPALCVVPLSADPAALNEARRALWTLALDGGPRAALLWDEAPAEKGPPGRVLLTPEGEPTPAAASLAPALRKLDGPVGRLLQEARREPATVGLLYSPASVRMQWLLEAGRLHPDDWLKVWGADTAAERAESGQLRLRLSWAKLLSDLGLPWRFVSSAEVEGGVLSARDSGLRVLVLPRAVALSNIEVEVLRAFVTDGGVVVADATCGRFDEHGRAREKPPLDELFGVDTSREPFAAQPAHALDSTHEASEKGQAPLLDAAVSAALAPAFSDEPVWLNLPPPRRLEYRRSPVLVRRAVGEGQAVYLNLDFEGYLSWRLHPDRPRAAATRAALASLAFDRVLSGLPEDLTASVLPPGTELVRLRLGGAPAEVRLLALRRNFQERLHEVGAEGDSAKGFEAPEPYKLVFRQPAWVADVRAGGATSVSSVEPPRQTAVVEGTLDPFTPVLLAIRSRASAPPVVQMAETARAGQVVTLRVQPGEGAETGGCFYVLRVTAPGAAEARWNRDYDGSWWAPAGVVTLTVPLALNDPPGDWSFTVREVTGAQETARTVKVLPPE